MFLSISIQFKYINLCSKFKYKNAAVIRKRFLNKHLRKPTKKETFKLKCNAVASEILYLRRILFRESRKVDKPEVKINFVLPIEDR
jgi:hypothetical protein